VLIDILCGSVLVCGGRFLSKVVMSHTHGTRRMRMSHVTRKVLMSHMTVVYGSARPYVVKDILCGSVWWCVAGDSLVK